MKQFVISRTRHTWGTEYAVADYKTKIAVLCAIRNQGLKTKIETFGSDDALKFTIQCRDLFGLTYDIMDTKGSAIGLLKRESWFSPLLQVTDARSGQTAQTIKVLPSLHEEYRLDFEGQALCLFRKASLYSTPLICCCLDESQISLNIMLTTAILMLGQGPAGAGGGAG